MSKKYYCCEVCVYYTSCEPNPFGVCKNFAERKSNLEEYTEESKDVGQR